MIDALQYPSLAGRTERVPTANTQLSDSVSQTLALALKAAVDLGEQIDRLKRHIYYGKVQDLVDIVDHLPSVSSSTPTNLSLTPQQYRLLHSALGLLTEAAEYAQTVAEHILEGKPLDEVNLRAELGDQNWYQAIPANIFGWSFNQWMTQNIDKLRQRYPEGFSELNALNRDLDAERAAVANPVTS